MSWGVVIIFAVAIAFAVGMHLAEQARLRKLFDRPCAGILHPLPLDNKILFL
jgi:hypothetical protein